MREASDEALWFLHAALEKNPDLVMRGSWGCLEGERPESERAAACPLTALVLGHTPQTQYELREARDISEARLAGHGFRARDFYGVWDTGVLPAHHLLRQLDAYLTSRTLGGRRP